MVTQKRVLRLPKDANPPVYGINEPYITLEIYHGGTMVKKEDIYEYVDGQVNHYDYCEPDLMSMLEVEEMFQQCSYSSGDCDYFAVDDGKWVMLEGDGDLLDIISKLTTRTLTIFVECHGSENLSDFSDDEYGDKNEMIDINVVVGEIDPNGVNKAVEGIDRDKGGEGIDVYGGYVEGNHVYGGYEESGESDDDSTDPEYDGDLDRFSLSSSSDDEVEGEKRVKWDEFNPIADMIAPAFKLGMLFSSHKLCAEAIKQYAINNGKQIRFKKCEKARVRAVCKEGCKWTLFASKMQDENTLQVKTFIDEHNCNRSCINKNVSAKWLAKTYVDKLRSNPNIPLSAFHEQVMAEWKVNVSRSKLFRAKRLAARKIEGSLNEQYNLLFDYAAELKRSNPGTTVEIVGETLDCYRFKRMYVCLAACKRGFVEYCRPLIGLDGCHLKGPTGGMLLAAVGVDPDNSIYPIAYAIAESENKDSWMWFIKLLKEDIGFSNSYKWTFMSDKQKGLVPALEELCPNSEKRFCVRHLYNNFKLENKGLALKEMFYVCAKATTMAEFEAGMKAIMEVDKPAFEWLGKKPPSQWSKSHFRIFPKTDMLLNNICECFNSMILEARDKSILTMLEKIRTALMKRMHVNKTKMAKYEGHLCPRIQEILEKTKIEASFCVPECSGGPKFQVIGPDGQFVVDLNQFSCACRKWDLTGIPCKHAIAGLYYWGLEPENSVSEWYHKSTYMNCYGYTIQPLNGPQLWEKTGLPAMQPPVYGSQLGRKKNKRRPEKDEKKQKKKSVAKQHVLGKKQQVSLKCSKCKMLGHNKRSCKAQIPDLPPKPKRKRAAKKVVETVPGQVASQPKRAKLTVHRSYSQAAYMGNITSPINGSGLRSSTQPTPSQTEQHSKKGRKQNLLKGGIRL